MKRNTRSWLAAALLAAAPFLTTDALAAPGDLDASFAGTGYELQGLGDSASGNAILSDYKNRLVMAYTGDTNPFFTNPPDYAVARYLDTGGLDTSFGSGGVVILPLPTKDLMCPPEVVEDDARRLLVATCNADTIFVWRLLTNGALDTTYGSGGIASVTVGPSVFPVIGLTQYKSRAMIATSALVAGTSERLFTLVRLTAGGALDPTLAGSGIGRYQVFATPNELSRATDVKLDRKGRIVLGGRGTAHPSLPYEFAFVRLDWHGAYDTSFNGTGLLHFPVLAGRNFGRRIAFDEKDRIVMAGTACMPMDPATGQEDCYAGAARVLDNGTLDGSFGSFGTAAFGGGGGPANPKAGFCTHSTYTYAIATFKDRVILSGMCDLVPFGSPPSYPGSTAAYVLRLDGAGQYDTSFGYTGNGYTYYDFSAPEAALHAHVIDKNGQIIAAGRAGKTVSATDAYGAAVTARMIQ